MRSVQNIIDLIIGNLNCERVADTVDTLKSGSLSSEVKGIVTTFTATWDVLQKVSAIGANLIITHEPTFYNHTDATEWLGDDEVYKNKIQFINENGISIWRFHDHWHNHKPDGIYFGVINALGWENYGFPAENYSYIFEIPALSLKDLTSELIEKLGLRCVRVIGDENISCTRVGLMVGGASIGMNGETIRVINRYNLDVLICGEIVEWTTCEYVRDASLQGMKKGLIVIGHERSEEVGMKYFAEWLKILVPDIPIQFVSAGEPFYYL